MSEAQAELLSAFCAEAYGESRTALTHYRILIENYPHEPAAKHAALRVVQVETARGNAKPETQHVVDGTTPARSSSRPQPLDRPRQRYPPQLMLFGVEGWVHLSFTVDTDGRTADIRIVDSDPPFLFELAAVEAMKNWRYEPYLEDGTPVDFRGMEIVLSFEMRKNFWDFR